MKYVRKSLALLVAGGFLAAQSNFAQTISEPPQAAPQSQAQLQQLVAPIALYPDALVAQILPAASYPEQIVEAVQWMDAHKGIQGDQLAKEVNAQPWDESVKALTQFPAVLANMQKNLAWTSELGDAYVNQQQEVSQAIQTMRQRAKKAGNLKDTPQEKVKTQGQTIVIEPSAPDVVYVPEYDPWLVYGAPMAMFPGWYPYPGLFLDSPGIGFGAGFGIGLFAGYGWGWHHWDYDWHHHGRVEHDHHEYISHSTTIVNRNHFQGSQTHFHHGGNSHGAFVPHGTAGMHSGAFGGFTHGGIARGNSFRGQSSFGGFHGGGGFHGSGGGFHGGGGHR